LNARRPEYLISLPESENQPLSIRAKALVFTDPISRDILSYVERIAPSDAPVLIGGETGTGKELVARHIHHASARRGAFLAVNCGAIHPQLAESELFGHEPGAFTGAAGRRAGWFEEANGGTLFLDEIGDLPAGLQVKLLRVLQEGEVTRVGATRPTRVNVRLVAATNVDLEQAVLAGHFRMDLFYRINLARVRLPPLRERPRDILPLAQHFGRLYAQRLKRAQPVLAEDAMQALLDYPWPGNIRELENVIHLALLVAQGDTVRRTDLKFSEALAGWQAGRGLASCADPPSTAAAKATPQEELRDGLRRMLRFPPPDLLRTVEAMLVHEAFTHGSFSQVRTAELLGISRNSVRTLLLRHGLIREPESAHAQRAPVSLRAGVPSRATGPF
jgi:DNA-binding NtrC family response regulator